MTESEVVIETLQEFRIRYQRPLPRFRHNPKKERLPENQWFGLNTAAIHEKLDHIVNRGSRILQSAGPEDEELQGFHRDFSAINTLPSKKTKVIAIVGKQGIGKSSLCNALLQRPDLAQTSNRGRACTQYRTKYTYRPGTGDQDKVFDVTVKFLDKATIQEMITGLIEHYFNFHFVTQQGDATYSEDRELAMSAEEALQILYNANDDLVSKRLLDRLTSEAIESGKLSP